jgi:cell wall-associated NlpC family hydrolase
MIEWAEYAAVMQSKIETLSKPEQFRFWCTNLVGAPYRWGKEGPLGTDCSGIISFALWMMDYDVRTTADVLMREVFSGEADRYDRKEAQAYFYVTTEARQHGSRIVEPGVAIHVAPVVGNGVVVNAGDFVTLSMARSIGAWFEQHRQARAELRTLDWPALRELSNSGRACWGVDPILEELRA